MILGIDEVGRGPWAGPLVVGAVVLGGEQIDGLTDSKKLTKKRREALYDEIYASAAGVGLGWVSAGEIDELGLGEALREATRRAVCEVKVSYHEIIIDGTVNLLTGTSLESYVTTMKKADLLVPSVSAASIVAKVARDRYMVEQDELYPGYKFGSHVGYGTAAHRAAIEKLGVTPLHRLSFAPLQRYAVNPRHSELDSESRQTVGRSWILGQAQNDNVTSVQGSDPCMEKKVTTKRIGDAGEDAAARELMRRGHEILERNWKTKYCEIDIVSLKDGVYYFTEVKHRRNDKAGDGLAAITPKKLNQMRYAAKFYAHTQKLTGTNLRLLAIATAGDPPEVIKAVRAD